MAKKLIQGNAFIKSIKVDGAEIHNGADLLFKVEEELIYIETSIGKSKVQKLEIVIGRDDSKIIIKDENKTSVN